MRARARAIDGADNRSALYTQTLSAQPTDSACAICVGSVLYPLLSTTCRGALVLLRPPAAVDTVLAEPRRAAPPPSDFFPPPKVIGLYIHAQTPREHHARVCPNLQFYTKCVVLILMRAVLTAHLSGGANTAPPSLWLDFGEGRGRKGKGSGREREGRRRGKGEEKNKKRRGKKKEGKGKRGEKGKGGILCSCDFSWENPCAILRGWLCRCGCKPTARCNKSRDCLRR